MSWPLLTSVARLPSGGESGGVGGFIRRCSGGSMLLVGMKEGELKDFIGEAMRNCLALADSSGDVDFEAPFGDFLFVPGNFLGDDWAPFEGRFGGDFFTLAGEPSSSSELENFAGTFLFLLPGSRSLGDTWSLTRSGFESGVIVLSSTWTSL